MNCLSGRTGGGRAGETCSCRAGGAVSPCRDRGAFLGGGGEKPLRFQVGSHQGGRSVRRVTLMQCGRLGGEGSGRQGAVRIQD